MGKRERKKIMKIAPNYKMRTPCEIHQFQYLDSIRRSNRYNFRNKKEFFLKTMQWFDNNEIEKIASLVVYKTDIEA